MRYVPCNCCAEVNHICYGAADHIQRFDIYATSSSLNCNNPHSSEPYTKHDRHINVILGQFYSVNYTRLESRYISKKVKSNPRIDSLRQDRFVGNMQGVCRERVPSVSGNYQFLPGKSPRQRKFCHPLVPNNSYSPADFLGVSRHQDAFSINQCTPIMGIHLLNNWRMENFSTVAYLHNTHSGCVSRIFDLLGANTMHEISYFNGISTK